MWKPYADLEDISEVLVEVKKIKKIPIQAKR